MIRLRTFNIQIKGNLIELDKNYLILSYIKDSNQAYILLVDKGKELGGLGLLFWTIECAKNDQ